jgi:uncharacterized membrane protein
MKLKDWIMLTATGSLVAVVVNMMVMFTIAILDPAVDDEKVFTIIGPAFQTIVGGFIGLITGINIGKKEADATE